MAIGSILSTAVSGLTASSSRAAVAAHNIVNTMTPGFHRSEVVTSSVVTTQGSKTSYTSGGVRALVRPAPGVATLDAGISETFLARDFADLILAETAYKASVKMLKTADEMGRQTLDLVG